jgi:hypothetical protein
VASPVVTSVTVVGRTLDWLTAARVIGPVSAPGTAVY